MLAEDSNAEVFVYTGEGGAVIPQDVIRIVVDPSVTSIPAVAFYERKKLAEVELCEGLVQIGSASIAHYDRSITKINIPNTFRRINNWAFTRSLRTPISLHDGIESIGRGAFLHLRQFRVPLFITVIPEGIVYN
jgi:hypothetical protein